MLGSLNLFSEVLEVGFDFESKVVRASASGFEAVVARAAQASQAAHAV
jgi:hypothetical protein